MNIEIKKDSTYTFSFDKYINDSETNISTATIKIQNSSGTVILTSTNMSISGNTATYALDTSASTLYEIDRNYVAILTIDNVDYPRFFDIVRYPFINNVTIEDLRDENREAIDIAGYKKEGTAESGTTTTAVDSSFIGEETFVGGAIEIYPSDNSERAETFTITTFDSGTGTFTFTPARSTAVSTNDFQVRRSFAEDIKRAGDVVKSALWKKERRAYLTIDNSQLNDMIVYKFFERLYARRRTTISDDDSNHVKYTYYRDLYKSEYDGLPLVYDSDNDGNIDSDEEVIKDSIRLVR